MSEGHRWNSTASRSPTIVLRASLQELTTGIEVVKTDGDFMTTIFFEKKKKP